MYAARVGRRDGQLAIGGKEGRIWRLSEIEFLLYVGYSVPPSIFFLFFEGRGIKKAHHAVS